MYLLAYEAFTHKLVSCFEKKKKCITQLRNSEQPCTRKCFYSFPFALREIDDSAQGGVSRADAPIG